MGVQQTVWEVQMCMRQGGFSILNLEGKKIIFP